MLLQGIHRVLECERSLLFFSAGRFPLRDDTFAEGGAFTALQFGALASADGVAMPLFGDRDFALQRERRFSFHARDAGAFVACRFSGSAGEMGAIARRLVVDDG